MIHSGVEPELTEAFEHTGWASQLEMPYQTGPITHRALFQWASLTICAPPGSSITYCKCSEATVWKQHSILCRNYPEALDLVPAVGNRLRPEPTLVLYIHSQRYKLCVSRRHETTKAELPTSVLEAGRQAAP